MAQQSLYERTLALLEGRGELTYEEIAEGAGIGIHWLHKFVRRATPNASAWRIEAVHNYLVKRLKKAA